MQTPWNERPKVQDTELTDEALRAIWSLQGAHPTKEQEPQAKVADPECAQKVEKHLHVRRFTTNQGLQWIDITAKRDDDKDRYTAAVVQALRSHHVHETLIEDAVEMVLLPQAVILSDCACVVFRCAKNEQDESSDSIQDITNRVTMFIFPNKVITLHRVDVQVMVKIRANFETRYKDSTRVHLLNMIAKGCSLSIHKDVSDTIVQFDDLESRLFSPREERAALARRLYHIKRKASVHSRLLAMQQEAFTYASAFLRIALTDGYYQDVLQFVAHARNLAEELNDSANNVLQLLFQLSSYQLNELMRVLTLFSAFFIPLSFITSVYGMNFEEMPGIHHPYGFLAICGVLSVVAAILLMWFVRRGFY